MLVQPYFDEIREGEISAIAIGSSFKCGIIKTPAHGEFRVQRQYGGLERIHPLSNTEIQFVETILEKLLRRPTFARIDYVMRNCSPEVVEIELIEPRLFLDHCIEVAEELAVVIAGKL